MNKLKISETDRVHAIFFTASALASMIEEHKCFKPFTFPNVKDLCRKLTNAIDYNSRILFKSNVDDKATDYSVQFIHLVERLINVVVIANHTMPNEDCIKFENEFNELLKKYNIHED
jgi:hypothetical protein